MNALLRNCTLAGLALLPSCLGSSDDDQVVAGSGFSTLFLEDMTWGRLVDVFDVDGVLVETDVVIRESIQDDGLNYALAQNLVTQADNLTILYPVGSASFDQALADAQSGLASLQTKAFDAPPPFTKVARNGAIRLEFSEFLDPSTVNRQTVQLIQQESQNSTVTLEVRYVVKEGVGADGKPKGIIIIDPTISKVDAAELNVPENGVGLPESIDQLNPNLKIRIPTKVNPFINQTQVLTSEAGNQTIDVKRNAAGDAIQEPYELAGFDPVVVRAFRSGNQFDAFKGFMTDNTRPSLVTAQKATITQVQASGTLRSLRYSIDAIGCRPLSPKTGDVFQVGAGEAILIVTEVTDPSDPEAYLVQAALLAGELAAGTNPRAATLTTRYTTADQALQLCYVTFNPEPTDLPATGVDPYATVSVTFSEPMDSGTVRSLDSFVLASVDLDADPGDPGRAVAVRLRRDRGPVHRPSAGLLRRRRLRPHPLRPDLDRRRLADLHPGADRRHHRCPRRGRPGHPDRAVHEPRPARRPDRHLRPRRQPDRLQRLRRR